MAETLEELEQRRAGLYQQMQALGDFRPGTISVNFRKCGKRGCACAQPGHAGHGPQYLWNTTSGGQSRAQNLRLGPELEKAQRELENHQVFLRCAGNWSRSMKRFVACALWPRSRMRMNCRL